LVPCSWITVIEVMLSWWLWEMSFLLTLWYIHSRLPEFYSIDLVLAFYPLINLWSEPF
jgi:hypothetical protein